MLVQCPRCGNIRQYVRGVNTQERCNHQGCSRSITRRHEVQSETQLSSERITESRPFVRDKGPAKSEADQREGSEA